MNTSPTLSFFDRHLSLWVVLCMGSGILVGSLFPGVPAALARLEVAHVSLPMAVLTWAMIFPMMLKIDFTSVRNVGREPRGLFVTWFVNWLVKPFTMFAIAWTCFNVLFRAGISGPLAKDYLAGAVLLGAAPCTAMVFVWSHLTKGDPAYTLVQVATNDLIILVAFAPIVKILLGVGAPMRGIWTSTPAAHKRWAFSTARAAAPAGKGGCWKEVR